MKKIDQRKVVSKALSLTVLFLLYFGFTGFTFTAPKVIIYGLQAMSVMISK